MTRTVSTLPAAVGVLAAFAAAHAQHVDIQLSVDEQGTMRTGLFDLDAGVPVLAESRVFEVEVPASNFTASPGFNSDSGEFVPFTAIGFRLDGPLLVWSGSSFDAPADDERVEITFSTFPPLGPVATPELSGEIVEGFTILVGSDGRWHKHLEYRLAAESPEDPAAQPDDGLYLMRMQMFSTDAAVDPTPWFYLVFNKGRTEPEVETAMDWVQTNRIDPPSCSPADVDGSRTVDLNDYFAFLGAFFAQLGSGVPGSPSADADGSGVVDLNDYFAFLGAFFADLGASC